MNSIEKFYALLVSEEVNIWHFHGKSESPRYYYWLLKAEPDNKEGHGVDTLEQLVEEAYGHIDPLRRPLPSPEDLGFSNPGIGV